MDRFLDRARNAARRRSLGLVTAAVCVLAVAGPAMAQYVPPEIDAVTMPIDIASVATQALTAIGLILAAIIAVGLGVAAVMGLYRKAKGLAGGRA